MDSYRIQFKPSAREEFWRVPFPHRRLLNRRLYALQGDPRPDDAERVGERENYRLTLGGWVMLYEIDDSMGMITVYGFRPGPSR